MMKTIMKLNELTTLDQLAQFLDGTQAVILTLNTVKKERYQWIQHERVRFQYSLLKKAEAATYRLMTISLILSQQDTPGIHRATNYTHEYNLIFIKVFLSYVLYC